MNCTMHTALVHTNLHCPIHFRSVFICVQLSKILCHWLSQNICHLPVKETVSVCENFCTHSSEWGCGNLWAIASRNVCANCWCAKISKISAHSHSCTCAGMENMIMCRNLTDFCTSAVCKHISVGNSTQIPANSLEWVQKCAQALTVCFKDIQMAKGVEKKFW